MIEWGKVYLSRGGIKMVCYYIDETADEAILAREDNGIGFRVSRKSGKHKRARRFDIIREANQEKIYE